MLVATSVPPHTDEQKRQTVTASHPGSAVPPSRRQRWRPGRGASDPAPASVPPRRARRRGRPAPPPVSGPGVRNCAPSPGPSCGGPRGARLPDGRRRPTCSTRARHRWSRSSRAGCSPRTPGAGHGSPSTARHAPRGTQISWAPPSWRTKREVARPEHHRPEARRAIGPRDLDVLAGRRVGVDRQRAGPYDGHRWQHRLGPLPLRSDQLAAGGVPRVQGPLILAVAILTGPNGPRPSSKSTAKTHTRVLRQSRR